MDDEGMNVCYLERTRRRLSSIYGKLSLGLKMWARGSPPRDIITPLIYDTTTNGVDLSSDRAGDDVLRVFQPLIIQFGRIATCKVKPWWQCRMICFLAEPISGPDPRL